MKTMLHDKLGVIGSAITAGGLSITWLETANLVIDVAAGLVAVVVGILTARYYWKKSKQISK